MGFLKKKFRDIKKFPRWIYFLPAMLMKCYYHIAFRHETDDPNGLLDVDSPKIGLVWHNRLLFFPCSIKKRQLGKTTAIISASRDGQYISDLLHHFGIQCARGSSSRGGAHAQREAMRELKNGSNVAITPDGPRGPAYILKKGAIQLASVTGVPIIAVALNASKYWKLKSWDGFQIPKPGAKLTLVVRGWFYIPPDLDADSLEKYRLEIENELKKISVD